MTNVRNASVKKTKKHRRGKSLSFKLSKGAKKAIKLRQKHI